MKKGIKRHPCLQPLSRDHLIALMGAQRLTKASDREISWETGLTFFRAVWEHEITQHLEDEERILPEFTKKAEDLDRLLSDHKQLRQFAQWLDEAVHKGEQDLELARQAGQFLDSHVRWEEREYFPRIEQTCSAEEIEKLESLTVEVERTRERGKACSQLGREPGET